MEEESKASKWLARRIKIAHGQEIRALEKRVTHDGPYRRRVDRSLAGGRHLADGVRSRQHCLVLKEKS